MMYGYLSASCANVAEGRGRRPGNGHGDHRQHRQRRHHERSGGGGTIEGMREIVLIDGARTPFGTFGGALRDTSATDIGVIAARAALERSKVDPQQIDHV